MPEVSPKFGTERTKRFRQTELSAADERTISHVEEFGCSILHVKGCGERPLFSYTVGVHDTCGGPELITSGLLEETAQRALNYAVAEIRNGVDLSVGRYREIVGEVEVEFRSVDPKWVKHLMGWAVWYYGGTDFSVLQLVYPDRENRFPEDEGFESYFAQPMLQPDAPMTELEEDFWAENDPKSSMFDWKFPDPPHTGVYLSETVNSGEEAVTYVSHDLEDGAWQFLGDSMSDGRPVLSCFHHPIDKDPSLKELFDLPLGWYAVRTAAGEPWERYEKGLEDDE